MPAAFWILEAAFRSALMAVAVWAGIRLLRVQAVRAQKLAWALVLLAAGAMPLAMHSPWLTHGLLGVPPVKIPLRPAAPSAPILAPRPADAVSLESAAPLPTARLSKPSPAHHSDEETDVPLNPLILSEFNAVSSITPAAPVVTVPVSSNFSAPLPQPAHHFWTWSRARSMGLTLYFAVAAVLLLRILLGMAIALRIWRRAEPATGPASGVSARVSRDLTTPVTIGSTVILPSDYAEWDPAKLRIVLAHEQSHIRQRDFYLQVLAALHAATFWFSPLGWWLQRKLSELGEALSDRAGLAESPSPAAYAQILLEFAAQPRTSRFSGLFTGPLTGVPMARSSNISSRIERILGSSRFQLAALTNRRHAILAAAMVPVALVAVVACIRIVPSVKAAQQTQAPAQPTPAQVAPSAPDQVTTTDIPQTATPTPAPDPNPNPSVSFGYDTTSGSGTSQAPAVPAAPPTPPTPPAPPATKPLPLQGPFGEIAEPAIPALPAIPAVPAIPPVPPMPPKSFAWGYSGGKDGNGSFAIIRGKDSNVYMNGYDGKALEEAKRKYHSDFLWFERDGKSYVITDPAIVAQAQALFQANQPLQIRQAELERMQAKLQAEMANLKPEIDQAKLPGPEFHAQMAKVQQEIANMHLDKLSSDLSRQFSAEQQAEFNKQLAELSSQTSKAILAGPEFQAQMGKLQQQLAVLQRSESKQLAEQIARQARENRRHAQDAARQASKLQADSGSDAQIANAEKLQELAEKQAEELQSQLGDLDGKFGDIQGRLGEIQGEIGERMGKVGEKQGEIGERMGVLGEEMGKIGEQQGKLGQEISRKVQSLIDRAILDGKVQSMVDKAVQDGVKQGLKDSNANPPR